MHFFRQSMDFEKSVNSSATVVKGHSFTCVVFVWRQSEFAFFSASTSVGALFLPKIHHRKEKDKRHEKSNKTFITRTRDMHAAELMRTTDRSDGKNSYGYIRRKVKRSSKQGRKRRHEQRLIRPDIKRSGHRNIQRRRRACKVRQGNDRFRPFTALTQLGRAALYRLEMVSP